MSKIEKPSRPRLGRGLNSLMSVSDAATSESSLPVMRSVSPSLLDESNERTDEPISAKSAVVELALGLISANPHQPRRTFDETSLAELAASLKSTGLIQPIIVRSTGGNYELIAGERRWRAARIAGLPSIPAIVREVDSAIQAQMALVENIQREDLNPIDRALSYRLLMDQLGLTQAELSARLGEDRSGIANYLRLLNLIEPVRAMVRDGRLSFGHAKLLAGVADMLEQQRLAEITVAGALSVRALESMLGAIPGTPALDRPAGPSPHIKDLEQSLSRQLGMRVQVRTRGKKGGGQLLIHYASLDQFDSLLTRLSVRPNPA